MSAEKPIEALIDSVADGDDIDWEALEAHADPEILAPARLDQKVILETFSFFCRELIVNKIVDQIVLRRLD